MAEAKISQLPAADLPLSGNELLEIVQDGVSKKVTAANAGGGGGVTLPIIQSPDDTLWLIGVNDSGVLTTTMVGTGTPTTLTLYSLDNTHWSVTVSNEGVLITTEI